MKTKYIQGDTVKSKMTLALLFMVFALVGATCEKQDPGYENHNNAESQVDSDESADQGSPAEESIDTEDGESESD